MNIRQSSPEAPVKGLLSRPTGIIVSIPRIFIEEVGKPYVERAFEAHLSKYDGTVFYWKIANRPRFDVLHCYIVFKNLIRWRCNIAGFSQGGPMTFWGLHGERTVEARAWMILSAPVVRAPLEIPMRGFRGFRYTDSLW